MKTVKLTKLTHIPDENFVPKKEGEQVPTATNYPGAVLNLSDELAQQLIDEGRAVEHEPEEEKVEGEQQVEEQ